MKSFLKIKTWVAALAIGLGCASTADATLLGFDDSNYIGWITPGNPPGTNELGWVNTLIGLAPDGTTSATSGPQALTRSSKIFSSLPTATSSDKSTDNGQGRLATSTSLYILGNYGNDGLTTKQASHVWYIGDVPVGEAITLPGGKGGDGLSHTTMMFGQRTNVPEGGTTLVLIGMALVSVGIARKRLSA